ncbi:MAG: hypothetical protein Q8P22_09025 [Chloroflexota bacterium]|nr:hypothetical protein [Chloroflexota bacterium]
MEAYEALRAFALGQQADGPPPRGLASFLRQGMPGWIGVWSRLEPPGPHEASPPPEGTWGRAGISLVDEIAVALVGMALADRR